MVEWSEENIKQYKNRKRNSRRKCRKDGMKRGRESVRKKKIKMRNRRIGEHK